MSTDPRDSVAGNYQQVYGYGAPPPSGFGRPSQGGMPSWVRVLIIVLLVCFGGCSALIGFGYYSMKKYGLIPSVPKARVVQGTAIHWKELKHWQGGLISGRLRSANFDGDAASELLLMKVEQPNYRTAMNGSYSPGGNVSIVELNGNERAVNLSGSALSDGEAWDYDGDGVCEVVAGIGRTEVYDTSGRFIAPLTGTFSYGYGQDVADVDGDGKPELLLEDQMSGGQTVAIGLHGKEVWRGTSPAYGGTWGNVDTDRLSEYIDTTGSGLAGTDMKNGVTTLNGWPGSTLNNGSFGSEAICCADIDGDGTDEVIAPRSGYLNPKTGKYVTFSRPLKSSGLYNQMAMTMHCAAVAGDFDGDGNRELAVLDSAGSQSFSTESLGTALVVYRADGSAQYYEEFGKWSLGLAVSRDGRRERLAVLLSDRLLLAP
jgi:hypothetical protein